LDSGAGAVCGDCGEGAGLLDEGLEDEAGEEVDDERFAAIGRLSLE
jgi:hypothetical protein